MGSEKAVRQAGGYGQLPEADRRALAEAEKNIERFRKSDAVLTFVPVPGLDLRGAAVDVRQVSHDFLFGTAVRYWGFPNPEAEARLTELFNFATLLEFNWAQYEPWQGQTHRDGQMAFARWCREHGITTEGIHVVWTREKRGTRMASALR